MEAIIDDIIKLNTSEDDPDLKLFKETKLSESQNLTLQWKLNIKNYN